MAIVPADIATDVDLAGSACIAAPLERILTHVEGLSAKRLRYISELLLSRQGHFRASRSGQSDRDPTNPDLY